MTSSAYTGDLKYQEMAENNSMRSPPGNGQGGSEHSFYRGHTLCASNFSGDTVYPILAGIKESLTNCLLISSACDR